MLADKVAGCFNRTANEMVFVAKCVAQDIELGRNRQSWFGLIFRPEFIYSNL